MLHNNELISIEEILVKPPQSYHERPIRQFVLFNRNTDLKICIYTLGARVMSCMLSEHQIIVDENHRDSDGDQEEAITTTTNDIYWDSHVFGSDTILLNNRQDLFGPRTLTYCLTKDNEFIIQGNYFDLIQNIQPSLINPFFFNLNSVESNPCLDEHYLHIRTSHESINVFTEQHDSLYGQFINPRVPSMISNCLEGSDFIYSTNPSTIPDSFLIATLTYKNRVIEIYLEIDRQTKSSLRILIKNGSIAFVPHDMSKFKVTYRFHW